jgi:hydroxymethylglutaryl-CoA lyase
VPQMADSDQICSMIKKGQLKLGKTRAWSLVPNRKGMERALRAGVTHFAVFTAVTDSFARRNIGMSIQDSLSEFRILIDEARSVLGKKLKVRGYLSTSFGCPFDGKVSAKQALRVLEKLAELEPDQISLGDTIGVATPKEVDALVIPALRLCTPNQLAVHFHDTRGTALANALRSFELGVRIMDSSAGGLGGCPFAPGATGNLATEDLVYMLHGMGIRTGINLDELCKVSFSFSKKIKRPLTGRYLQSFVARCRL